MKKKLESNIQSQDWVQTGTWLLDQVLRSDIPQGKMTAIIGESQVGKSYYTEETYLKQIRYYMISIRRQKIKKILDSL